MYRNQFDFASAYADTRSRAGFKNRVASISEAIRFWNNVEHQFKTERIKEEILSHALKVAGSHNRPTNPEELVKMSDEEEPMVLGKEHQSPNPKENVVHEASPVEVDINFSPTSTVLATRVSALTYREVQQLADELGMPPDDLADWADVVTSSKTQN